MTTEFLDFSEVVLFFNTHPFEVMGDLFEKLQKFCEEKGLDCGYYKDDKFLNSMYVVLPQKDRVVLILCPQGSDRYHNLHFNTERFKKFFSALEKC